MKPDYYVELREECGPLGLQAGQEFSGQEALQVFVISDHINHTWGIEIFSPEEKVGKMLEVSPVFPAFFQCFSPRKKLEFFQDFSKIFLWEQWEKQKHCKMLEKC